MVYCFFGIYCYSSNPEETTHPPYVTLRNKRIPELLPRKTAEVFVDDTVVRSQEVEDHGNDLAKVLVRLIANGITLKMEKGIWGTDELPLLELLVHMGKGVACAPDTIKELVALEPNTIVKGTIVPKIL